MGVNFFIRKKTIRNPYFFFGTLPLTTNMYESNNNTQPNTLLIKKQDFCGFASHSTLVHVRGPQPEIRFAENLYLRYFLTVLTETDVRCPIWKKTVTISGVLLAAVTKTISQCF